MFKLLIQVKEGPGENQKRPAPEKEVNLFFRNNAYSTPNNRHQLHEDIAEADRTFQLVKDMWADRNPDLPEDLIKDYRYGLLPVRYHFLTWESDEQIDAADLAVAMNIVYPTGDQQLCAIYVPTEGSWYQMCLSNTKLTAAQAIELYEGNYAS